MADQEDQLSDEEKVKKALAAGGEGSRWGRGEEEEAVAVSSPPPGDKEGRKLSKRMWSRLLPSARLCQPGKRLVSFCPRPALLAALSTPCTVRWLKIGCRLRAGTEAKRARRIRCLHPAFLASPWVCLSSFNPEETRRMERGFSWSSPSLLRWPLKLVPPPLLSLERLRTICWWMA